MSSISSYAWNSVWLMFVKLGIMSAVVMPFDAASRGREKVETREQRLGKKRRRMEPIIDWDKSLIDFVSYDYPVVREN